jgi:tRNA-Thr(GGU) m(6)t(6)A37 methyltransferase TsaA
MIAERPDSMNIRTKDDVSSSEPTAEYITLRPVGIVHSEIKEPMLRAGDDGLTRQVRMQQENEYHEKLKTLVSELVVDEWFSGILDGIDGFSHILVLYWPHLVASTRRNLLKVHPMGRKDIPRQGIFATCSPARPNPVLVTAVRLLERIGNVLRVQGLEAVDGSPIVDIKPYNPRYYHVENAVVPEWMTKLQREISER